VQSSLSGSATYSDNINLAPPGQERSDLVMVVSPLLSVQRNGPRLRLQVAYSPELLFYTNGTNSTSIRNTLDGSGTAEIVQGRLYFDALARISQQNVSPYGTLAANSVNGSNNRAEARTLSFGPYLRSNFGQDGSYQLGYRHSRTEFNNAALSRSETNEIYGSASGNTGLRDLNWGLNANRQDANYAGLRTQRFEQASGTLTYRIESRISVHATAGFDRNSYTAFSGETSKGSYYSAGFDWSPTPTTSLSGQYGHRYFGATELLQFSHRSRDTIWQLGYTKDRTTSAELLSAPADANTSALLTNFFQSRYPDPAARAQAITSFLQQQSILPNGGITQFNFLSNQVFLQQRLDASVSLIGKRSTISLGINSSKQTALSDQNVPSDVFATSRSFRQSGVSANWNYTLGQRTSATFSAQRQKSEAVGGPGKTTQRILSASVQRQLQRNLTATLTVHNIRQDGTANYKENAIAAAAHLQF
jgi:uncharacterized protein (PEP-CTERM system associated)